METKPSLDGLQVGIRNNIRKHQRLQKLYAVCHSGISVLVPAALIAAILLPTDRTWQVVASKVFAGAATALFVLERTLSLGARWRYHREMQNGYLAVLAKISFYQNLPEGFGGDDRKVFFNRIFEDMSFVANRETMEFQE